MKYYKYLVFLLILSVCLTGCKKTIIDELPENYYINLNDAVVDVYSDSKLSDIIDKTNIKYDEDYKLNTDTLGEKTIELKFNIEEDDNTYIYHLKYNVKDLSKPRILSSGDRYVTVNSDIWLCDYIMYGDEYSSEPVCRVDGEYDLNTVGDYNIKYIVSDDAGNESEFDTVLHVIEPSDSTSNNKKTNTYFSNVLKNYKNDNTLVGIDVSSWQGDIDFNKVKDAGASFVIIRIGVELSKDKIIEIDDNYLENIKKAKDVGLKVGVYFYSNALDKKTAINQAKWVIDTLDNEKLDLPIIFDWENFSNWNNLHLSFHDINEISNSFLETVEKSGYDGMLYSSPFYLKYIWKSDFPIWLAHYTSKTDYEGNYKIWQMCNNGIINGIDGDVDIDIMYLDE